MCLGKTETERLKRVGVVNNFCFKFKRVWPNHFPSISQEKYQIDWIKFSDVFIGFQTPISRH